MSQTFTARVIPLFQNAATKAVQSSAPLAREAGSEFVKTAAQMSAVLTVYAVALGGAYAIYSGYELTRRGIRRLRQSNATPADAPAASAERAA